MAANRPALILATSLFLTAMLLAQETKIQPTSSKTLSGSSVEHIVLGLANGKFQRFLGADLRLREISYTLDLGACEKAVKQGTLVFSHKSALWKKLRGLQKKAEEFEMVIYFLEQGKLRRARCQGVKVLSTEEKKNTEKKYILQWTARSIETETVQESPQL